MSVHGFQFLGIRFWNAETDALCREMDTHGGALMVPSAPSLAQALGEHREGKPLLLQAHREAAWAVVDGGYVALILRLVLRKRARRISGRQLIERLFADAALAVPMRERRVLWVVPSGEEAGRISRFLESTGFSLQLNPFYEAPYYKVDTDFHDTALIARIEAETPDWVVVCIGGGRQEKLAHFLQRAAMEKWCEGSKVERRERACTHLPSPNSHLPSRRKRVPAILCTGAAIAFFTGGQTGIPKWADRLYLGWLWRICEDPRRYGRRYGVALWQLPHMLWVHRREL